MLLVRLLRGSDGWRKAFCCVHMPAGGVGPKRNTLFYIFGLARFIVSDVGRMEYIAGKLHVIFRSGPGPQTFSPDFAD